MTTQPIETDDFGFGLRAHLSLTDWLNATPEDFGEYLHVVYDTETRELRLYRTVGECGSNERVLTTLDDVAVSIHDEHDRTVKHWYLTWGEAHTLMTWLTALNRERSPARISVEYYSDNGKTMYDDLPIGEESLIFTYKTESGRENWISLNSTYTHAIHRLAKFE